MRPVHVSIPIDAPRERVFELLLDLGRRPSFCDHFQHGYRLQRMAASGVGAAARFHLDAPRSPIWMETRIEKADEPRRIVERGRGGRWNRIPIATAWEIAAGPGRGCEVSLTFWIDSTHPVDLVRDRLGAGRWYRRQWVRALRRLAELAESGAEVEAVSVAGGSRLPV